MDLPAWATDAVTVTRPARIMSSACLRLAMPHSARYFCNLNGVSSLMPARAFPGRFNLIIP